MKKILFLSVIALTIIPVFIGTLGCNQIGKEKAKQEMADSVRIADSIAKAHNPYKYAEIEIRTYKSGTCIKPGFEKPDSCWGYDIYVFGGLMIHQPHIPAVSGSAGFKTEEYARKTAEFVVYKIRNNIMPPGVSFEELDSLGVLK